jgi:hypothetical protein
MGLQGFWIKGFAILSGRVTFRLSQALRLRPDTTVCANLSFLDTPQNPGRDNMPTGQQIGRRGVGVWHEVSVNFIGR